MSTPQSSVVFSALPSSPDGCQALSFHELSTSSQLHQLKPPPVSAFSISTPNTSLPPRKTVACLPSTNSLGSTVISVSGRDGRNGLLAWSSLNSKPTPSHKLIPPGRVIVLGLSPLGTYLATGSADGVVMLWEFSTGTLLATFDAHYKSITCLAFSDDEAALVTASEDSMCSVWSIPTLIDEALDSSLSHAPYSTFSDHTLPISDVQVSAGTFPDIRIFTASLDRTIKIWSPLYAASPLLSTFAVPGPAHHLAVDSLERFILVSYGSMVNTEGPKSASSEVKKAVNVLSAAVPQHLASTIRIIPLFSRPAHGAHQGGVSLVHGSTGFVHETGSTTEDITYTSPHSTSITALHLPSPTVSSSILLCGLSNGKIVHLSIPSLQPLGQTVPHTGSTPTADAVVLIVTFPRPPDLLQTYSGAGAMSELSAGPGASHQALIPSRPIGALGRVVGKTGDGQRTNGLAEGSNQQQRCKDHTTMLKLGQSRSSYEPRADEDDPFSLPGEVLRTVGDHLSTISQLDTLVDRRPVGEQTPSAELVKKLTAETSSLKDQLAEALALNDAMWSGIVDGTLKFKSSKHPGNL